MLWEGEQGEKSIRSDVNKKVASVFIALLAKTINSTTEHVSDQIKKSLNIDVKGLDHLYVCKTPCFALLNKLSSQLDKHENLKQVTAKAETDMIAQLLNSGLYEPLQTGAISLDTDVPETSMSSPHIGHSRSKAQRTHARRSLFPLSPMKMSPRITVSSILCGTCTYSIPSVKDGGIFQSNKPITVTIIVSGQPPGSCFGSHNVMVVY